MTLLTHIVRVDIRRFHWLILAWTVLTLVAFAMEGAYPFLVEPGTVEPLNASVSMIVIARAMVMALGIALIVQAHPLVGSTAFWMTRPIPPRTLMLAKLLLTGGVFLAVPAACEVVLMAFYRVPPAKMVAVVLDSVLLRAAGLVLLMVLAGWTGSVARFALLLGGLLAALVVAINVAVMAAAWWPGNSYVLVAGGSILGPAPQPVDHSADIVGMMLFVLGLLVLLRAQFQRLAPSRLLALTVAVPVIAWLAAVLWPWSIVTAHENTPEWAAALELAGNADSAVVDAGPLHEDAMRHVKAETYLRNLPPGWIATTHLAAATFTHAGGVVTSLPYGVGAAPSSGRYAPAQVPHAIETALGVKVAYSFGLEDRATILAVRDADLPGPEVVGAYRGEFDVRLITLDVAATLPLAPGATFQDGAYRFVVHDVRLDGRTPAVRVRISNAASVFQRATPDGYSVFIRNGAAGVALAGDRSQLGYGPVPASIFGWRMHLPQSFGFRAGLHTIRFPPAIISVSPPSAFAPRGPRVAFEENWLRDAELVLVRTRYAGTVRRTLELEGVTLKRQ